MGKSSIGELKEAMEEAFIAEWGRLVLLGDKVLEYDCIRGLPHFGLRDILTTQMELDLCSYVRYLQLEQVGQVFSEISRNVARYENYYPGDMRYFIRYLFKLLFVMHTDGDEKAQEDLQMSFDSACKPAKNFQQMIKIFYLFLDEYLKNILKKMQEKKGKPVEDAKKYIEQHYGESISQENIARMLQLSPTYFSKIFKAEMNIGFAEYIVQVRLEKAKDFLLTTNFSVKEIAYKVGYTDDKYFSKLFKKQIGIKPTEFRKLYAE